MKAPIKISIAPKLKAAVWDVILSPQVWTGFLVFGILINLALGVGNARHYIAHPMVVFQLAFGVNFFCAYLNARTLQSVWASWRRTKLRQRRHAVSEGKYILTDDGQRPTPERDADRWAHWLTENRETMLVAWEDVAGCRVITIFMGLDMNFEGTSPAHVWGTRVFGGALDMKSTYCGGVREQAEAMHANMVRLVQATEAKTVQDV